MIQAAIDPETKEFLGLIIPKADLDGRFISIFGRADRWAAQARGEMVPANEVGVIFTSDGDPSTLTRNDPNAAMEVIEVDHLAGGDPC